MGKLIITVTAKRLSGPRAGTAWYISDVADELDGMEIEVQDPDRDEPTVVRLDNVSVEAAS